MRTTYLPSRSQNQLLALKKYLIYKSHFGQQFLLSLILYVLNFFDIKLSISFKEIACYVCTRQKEKIFTFILREYS